MTTTRVFLAAMLSAAICFFAPAVATAQQTNVPPQVRAAEEATEDAARRFRLGVSGGVALDPELIDVGAHASFGPIFTPALEFRPGLELGLGEVTTMFGINLDVLYRLRGGGRWTPYFGGGPNFALSHRGFETDEEEHVDVEVDGTDAAVEEDDSSRFDFSDTDFTGGFNFIAGARRSNGLFVEMKATAYGVTNIRLLVGFNF